MKKLYTLLTAVIVAASAFAQTPEKMSYQAVVRDAGNALVPSQAVGMQLSILQGSVSGTAVYVETQNPTTNINGLVSIEIGSGAVVSGTFNAIDWSAGPYFIKTETDPTGGTAYTIAGTNQLLSVPYALYAETAENATNDLVDDADADPTNEINTGVVLNGTDLEITDGSGTIVTDLSSLQDGVNDADSDPTNELQDWTSLPGIPAGLADGIDDIVDADADPANEMNTGVVLNGTNLEITDGGGTIVTNLSSLQDGVTDADADPINELQSLTLTGTILSINGGNSVDLAPLLVGGGGGSAPTANTILVGDDYFDPEYLQVNVGDTITWQWVDGIHTTTSNNTTGNDVWDIILSASNPTYTEVIDDVDNHYYYDQLSSATGLITTVNTDVVPSGTLISYAGNNIPVGWKVCDGSEISRTTYQYLFLSIGTSWGEGDGATTFNLPDLRGQFLRGVNNGAGVDPDAATRTALNIGGNVGDTVGTYQQDEVKAHDHGYQHLAIGGSTRTLESTPFGNNSSWQNFVSDLSGGLESRPKNASVYFIIKL